MRMTLRARTFLLAAMAVLLLAVPVAAQEVERTGRGDVMLDRRLDRILGAGEYLLITRDTLIAEGDSVPGDLLVLDARLTLAGAVAGDVVGVEADLFIRPSARVGGDVVNIAGGLYRSEVGRIGGGIVDAPLVRYQVTREDDVIRIVAATEYTALELHGVMGLHLPTYDRVDALGLNWAATYRPRPLGSIQPALYGMVGYRSGRGAWQGKTELAFIRAATGFAVGVEELTQTNEWWIRGPLLNTLGYFGLGTDARDYFEARRVYVRLDQSFGRGNAVATAQLRAQVERGRSLGAGDPWTVLGGSTRPNLPIDDGTISSLLSSLFGGWRGTGAQLDAGGSVEVAGSALGGDFSFTRFVLWGEWAMHAFRDHTLEVEWQLRGPFPGTRSLPRQRWSFVGGSGTLPTFETAQFRGDRLAFVESAYIIPLPERWSLPIIGAPDLEIVHAAGMAWTEAERRGLEQNIGVRLVFLSPYLRVVTDPSDPIDALEIGIGLTSPFDGNYPWRRRTP